jgi:hypothetical protein
LGDGELKLRQLQLKRLRLQLLLRQGGENTLMLLHRDGWRHGAVVLAMGGVSATTAASNEAVGRAGRVGTPTGCSSSTPSTTNGGGRQR